ncbi:hypothetical protein [Erwinia mallotivora]|nr:hypothetical protein [Erwinia mallotivora]
MSHFLCPAAAYLNRRNELLAERSVVTSTARIQIINKALLAGEIAMATCHDLDALHGLQQRKARLIKGSEQKRQRELQRFQQLAQQLPPVPCEDEAACIAWQQQFSGLIAAFPWQHASPEQLQNALFSTTLTQWQKTLEILFTSASRQPLFVRMAEIVAFSLSRTALLGEATEVWRALMAVWDSCQQRGASDAAYFVSLESYSDAAHLCSRAILLFCFTCEAVVRGQPLPDRTQLDEQIKQHHHSVIDGTHAFFDR